jgi:cytoskeleton protein RodZ
MSIGAQLRTARETKGLSIGTVAQRTRVQPRTLAAIELDDVRSLPPRPFGRGFVRAYAEEVDLDPDRTVRDYFAQFPSTFEPNAPPPLRVRELPESAFDLSSKWSGLATATGILLLVVVAAVVLGRRGETAGPSEAVGTTGGAPATTASPERQTPGSQSAIAQPAAVSPAAAPAAPLSLVFRVSRPCWVTASADGQRTIYRTLQAGDRETLNAEREIVIRFGDAAAVEWTINGRTGSSLGAPGAIRDLRITPENAATVQ